MRRICILFLTAFLVISCNNQRKAPKTSEPAPVVEPEMTGEQMDSLYQKVQSVVFDERIYDFGDILEKDGIVKRSFVYRNNSGNHVTVLKTLTPCKCTFADFKNESVAPGGKGAVEVSYNPYGRPGKFSEEVAVFFSDSVVRRVHVKGNVIPFNHPVTEDHPYELGRGLYSSLKVIRLGGVRQSQDAMIRCRFANDTDKPMEVRFNAPEEYRRNLIFPETMTLAPDERVVMNLGYHMPEGALGLHNVDIQVVVNGVALEEPLNLQAVGTLPKTEATERSPALSYTESSFQFKPVNDEQPFEIKLSNTGRTTLTILSVSLPDGVRSELADGAKIRPGETGRFSSSLIIPASCNGDYHNCIYIVTNDPVRPYLGINLNTIK